MDKLEEKTEEVSKLKSEWNQRNTENSELKIINAQLVTENQSCKTDLEAIGETIEQIKAQQDLDAKEKAELTEQLEKTANTLELANSDHETIRQGFEIQIKE